MTLLFWIDPAQRCVTRIAWVGRTVACEKYVGGPIERVLFKTELFTAADGRDELNRLRAEGYVDPLDLDSAQFIATVALTHCTDPDQIRDTAREFSLFSDSKALKELDVPDDAWLRDWRCQALQL